MASVNGQFTVNGRPINGASVKAWPSSAFVTLPPAFNTAIPSGTPSASGTTGEGNGGDGSYYLTSLSNGEYYVSVEWNGLIAYDYHNVQNTQTLYSVMDYGATGDGSTDDTAAIQAAITAVAALGKSSNTGGEVFFPPGKYIISSPLVLPRTGTTPTNVVRLRGANPRSAWLSGKSTFPADRGMIEWATTAAVPAWHQSIKDLRFTLPNVSGTTAIYFAPVSGDPTTWTVNQLTAEKLQIDIENVLVEGNNDYHQRLVYLRGNITNSRIHGLWGDPGQGSVNTYDTRVLEFDYTYASAPAFGGDDAAGFHYGEISELCAGMRRGGYVTAIKGRLHRSVMYNCHQGTNAQVDPVFHFLNTTAVVMRDFTLEGGASQPQVRFDTCRNLSVEYIGAGSPKFVNGHTPGNGIELYGCQDITWRGELRRSGNPVFSTSGHYLLNVDSACQRCRFYQIDTNGPVSGEILWNPPLSGDCYLEAWDVTNLAFYTLGRQQHWNFVRNVRTITATTGTTTEADEIILSNPTSNSARTQTLATPATVGRRYEVKDSKGDAGTRNITISPASGLIDGAATYVISTNYDKASFVWDGTNWSVV